jgi:HPt (histidine-containing phosphotransfer) domain-containing protein
VTEPPVTLHTALQNLPGFDLNAVIAMLGDEQLIVRLMGIFYQDSINTLAEIATKISHSKPDAVRAILHHIKGSAGTIGAVDLLEATILLEQNLEQRALLPLVKAEFARALNRTRESIHHVLRIFKN